MEIFNESLTNDVVSFEQLDPGVLHPFQHYLSHLKRMKRWKWKALCNEAPYSHELNSASSGIQIQILMIGSQER